MNLNEEIALLKEEKEIEAQSSKFIAPIVKLTEDTDADRLSIEYSDPALELRAYDFRSSLKEALDILCKSSGIADASAIIKECREVVDDAFERTNSKHSETMIEGYAKLASMKLLLESFKQRKSTNLLESLNHSLAIISHKNPSDHHWQNA